MTEELESLTAIVTTDIAGITRGRFVATKRLDKVAVSGSGWTPANISITPFGGIADPNPFGSAGDLKIMPDLDARFRTSQTGASMPFDMVPGNIVNLDGSPWPCCTRTMLRDAIARLHEFAGLSIIAAFEQEFQIFGADFPPAHVMSMAALRRAGPFAPMLMTGLEEAGVEPEMILAEYGSDQFEVTHGPAPALVAADRAVAIREITREIAENLGWKASFAPKTQADGVGNGVHIHFSLIDGGGHPVAYDPSSPGNLSSIAGSFCAGIVRHLPALTAFTAASVPSYYRLQPHHWSAAYTWLGEKDRESTLRICPVSTVGGKDPARQYNIEYRAADATANPYLALAVIIQAGIEGIIANLPAPEIFSGDPALLGEVEREEKGLLRLPGSLEDALQAFEADEIVKNWFQPLFISTYLGEKRAEIQSLDGKNAQQICDLYRTLF